MKHTHMIVAVLISCSGLNAMVPDVTKWQEICKDPEKKQQLMTIYKDFCQKRVRENIAWTVGSVTPFIFRSARKNIIPVAFCGLFGARQTYLLGRNIHRNQVAEKEDLSCLNDDVLEQLGNPRVRQYEDGSLYSIDMIEYTDKYRNRFLSTDRGYHKTHYFKTNDVDGIKKALSGNYKDRLKFVGNSWENGSPKFILKFYYERFLQTSWVIDRELQSFAQRVKKTITNEVE